MYKSGRCHECFKKFHRKREFRRRLAKLDMTASQFWAMARSQSHRCLVCRKRKDLVPDHDHRTGHIRGLLCSRCNLGLGLFEDNSTWLVSAASYLSTSSCIT
ncbi:MAG: endonuclease VII domain-containing protein [Thermoplasmata archaeon]